MADTTARFIYLSPVAARLGRAAARPRAVAIASVIALTALGWFYLALQAGRADGLFAALCRPLSATGNALDFSLIVAMWTAMALAMMVPSAGPMILTYAEIAETAAHKGKKVVSPLVLAAGYLTIWLVFALAASLAFYVLPAGEGPVFHWMSALIFAGAGLYQFTTLKHACLQRCRTPFQFFFMNWRTTSGGVFALGLRQGMYCLGCCWAMMLVMLAAGAMNVVWMAVLAAAMTIEKLARGPWVSRMLGVSLLVIAGLFVLAALGMMPI